MSINRKLSTQFDTIASVLEVMGANAFKINANRRVARIIKEYPTDLAEFAGDKKGLTSIEGIGSGSADRILEFIDTGQINELTQLASEIPQLGL